VSPKQFTKKPSRRELVSVIAHLQGLIGSAKGAAWNDRSEDRIGDIVRPLDEGFNLCVAALSFDPPQYLKEWRKTMSDSINKAIVALEKSIVALDGCYGRTTGDGVKRTRAIISNHAAIADLRSELAKTIGAPDAEILRLAEVALRESPKTLSQDWQEAAIKVCRAVAPLTLAWCQRNPDMTMPTLMNCSHNANGLCFDCVRKALTAERKACADIALAIDSGRGNEKEIAAAIFRRSDVLVAPTV
jgi:hypothetical protein